VPVGGYSSPGFCIRIKTALSDPSSFSFLFGDEHRCSIGNHEDAGRFLYVASKKKISSAGMLIRRSFLPENPVSPGDYFHEHLIDLAGSESFYYLNHGTKP
jgi:hypothetical protein